MKLSNFPYLIQKEILDHLSINQLFFFSLCSKNTNKFIKETQNHQLKKVERVTYSITSKFTQICVKMANKSCEFAIMYLFKSKMAFQWFMGNGPLQEVQVNELATPIDFLRCITTNSDLHAKYFADTVEPIIESVHSKLYDLLGNDTKFWLKSVDFTEEEGTFFLPLLQNIQKMDVYGTIFESTKIDEFLDRSTCLEHFWWDTMSTQPIQLRADSKFYDLDTVYVYSPDDYACHLTNDVLERFNGRHALLRGRKIDTPDVIQFLNEWKSGEKYKNLELISMNWRFNLQEIWKSVEIKEVDREVKYPFKRRFEEQHIGFSHLEPGELESRYYMVRESDGHVASVMLTSDLIMMGVWNMKEKEFLIKSNQPIEAVPFF